MWSGSTCALGRSTLVRDLFTAQPKRIELLNCQGTGTAALWLGEVDDLWQMGEPRGQGGPWKNTAVTANTPSDPFLMYDYDDKELTLTSSEAATITVEVDFLADSLSSRTNKPIWKNR